MITLNNHPISDFFTIDSAVNEVRKQAEKCHIYRHCKEKFRKRAEHPGKVKIFTKEEIEKYERGLI